MLRLKVGFIAFFALASTTFAAVDMNVSAFNDVPDPVAATNLLEYQITVENSGDEDAANATLDVDVPVGTSFVSVDDGRCTYVQPNNKVECDFGALAGTLFPATGSPIDIVIQVRAELAGGGGTTITSTALAANTNPDSNPGNNSLSEITTIIEGSDLQLDPITATPNPVSAAGTVSYDLTASNNGPNSAADAQIVFNLPADVDYQGFSGSNWSCSDAGQVITCNYSSSIAVSGVSSSLSISGQVLSSTAGTLTSSATVSSTTPDGIPDNNTQTHDLTVEAGTDLSMSKSIDSDPVTAGAPVQFTLLVNNNGPMTATNLLVTDTLPADYTAISASGTDWGCGVTGQTVSCTRSSQVQGSSTILIDAIAPATAPPGGTTHTNNATVTSDTTDPIPANDTGSVSYGLFPDGVDLTVSKSKTPSPVAQGSDMTSTVVVSNSGPRDASATIRAVDSLHAGESFVSANGSGWSCSYAVGTHEVTCDRAGPLANGDSTPTITIITTANAAGTLQNEVCASHVSAPTGEAEANPGNDCDTASSNASVTMADLQLVKITGDANIDTSENSFTYTLTVTNAGPETATGITLTDAIPMYLSGTSFRPATGIAVVASDGTVCSTGSTVTCNLQDMANGAVTTVNITVTRPMSDGDWTNTAAVFSSNIGDPNRANNTASAPVVTVAGIADMEMTAKTVTPTSVRAGVEATYVLSFRNSGASTADNVVVTDTFNPAGVGAYTFISATASKGSCSAMAGDVLTCNIGSMARNETQSVTVVIRPDYMAVPPTPRVLPNTADVSTTTTESDSGNNSQAVDLDIIEASLDLIINKSDVTDPVGFDSTASPKGEIVYQIRVDNQGPSYGSNIVFTDTITTPAGKNLTFTCDRDSASGACSATTYCNNQGLSFTGTQAFSCNLGATLELAAGSSYTRYLVFETENAPDPGGDTYQNTVAVTANEPESNSANNSANESTTVRGIVDLEITSKTPSADPVNLREPFTYTITITNNGPSDSGGVNGAHPDDSDDSRLTDSLPTGMELTGTPTVLPLASDQGANNRSCTGVAGDTSFNCDLRTVNSGSSLTVTVPVRVVSYSATLTNSATVFSDDLDATPGNDSNSGLVNIQKSSIAGTVFRDFNDNGVEDPGETGIELVDLQISGLDLYGNSVLATVTTDSSGNYLFDNLPVSDATGYTITELTQPAGMFDGQDSVSSVVVPGSKNTDAHSGIVLASNTVLTEYRFGELPAATLSGFVWHDASNDGIRDAGETESIGGVTLTLTGTDDLGNPVNEVVTSSATDGSYQFTDLRPSDASGYTVTETQPTTHLPGLAATGSGATSAGAADNSPASADFGNIISAIGLNADDDAIAYNFGELQTGSIAGTVFNDINNNAALDGDESGIAGVTVTLTGNDYLGNPVSITVTTDSDGNYLFDNLPPSDTSGYTLTETQPQNYQDGTITPGNLGGTAGSNLISGIVFGSGQAGTDYLFAERSATLSGAVYVDKNGNAAQDPGEPGIPNVAITLSGTDVNGNPVNETVTTDANGDFTFTDIPAGNGSGYTLTETHPVGWIDGLDTAGTAGGVVGNDVITGIPLTGTTSASGYLFGESSSSLSGTVFNDSDNSGIQDIGELPIENVTITLTGTDDLGNPVNLTTTTDADGNYSFVALVPGTYTITETQPPIYIDGTVSAGSLGGTVGTNQVSSIILTSGDNGTGYNFAERSAEVSGSVYVDGNNNGIRDTGEGGIPSVVITLSGTDANSNPVSETVNTDANGSYVFIGLPPSDGTGYTLTETQPATWMDGTDSAGNAGGVVGNDVISGIVLTNTAVATDYNFGELAGTLSGGVFSDTNNDGIRDTGELPIENVTITLAGTDDLGNPVTLTTTTDTDGNYSFEGLRPGTYSITETQPVLYQDGVVTAGSLGGTVGTNVISDIVLSSGDAGIDYNFAERSGSIAGSVYVDSNNNGIRDSGETGIADTTLQLSGTDDQGGTVNLTTQTDSNGDYIFTGLSPSGASGYTVTEIQPAAWADSVDTVGTAGGVAGNDVISAIPVTLATTATGYDFGEVGGSLGGTVFNDLNNNGFQDANEPGIPGVTLILTGNDINGNPVSITVITADNGSYAFADLPLPDSNGYTITETQPANTADGQVSAGSFGGTVGINLISGIQLPEAGADGVGYNFAEISNASAVAAVSGKVWLDTNHDRVDNEAGSGREGWQVQLIRRDDPLDNDNFTLIATVVTDSNGEYNFAGLLPGSGYEIRFLHPSSNLVYGSPLSSEPGVDLSYGTIRNLTLNAGNNILNQNLPLDPAGVVYDSLSRTPIIGAVVSISGPAGFDPATHLVGGLPNVNQATGPDGFYQFLLFDTAPAGTYTLSVVEPSGYLPDGSVLIPECSNSLMVTALPDPALVHSAATAPASGAAIHDPATCPAGSGGLAAGADSTQHYLTFDLTPGVSGDVVNNHIPLDRITNGALSVVKSTPKVNVSIGELVPYTISVTNNMDATLNAIVDVEDQIPPGFKYVKGSSRLDGVAREPQVNGRSLLWPNLSFTAKQTRRFKLVLVVGSGVSEGDYVNQAWSENSQAGQTISNIGTATVRVVPDPTFDCTDIIGKVYDDSNLNGYPDEGEKPLPGVRIATARGWLVTTDEFGRYHIACAAVPNSLRGSNFILKVDERSLPSGYRITTENPRVVRLTRGKVAKTNFGAAIHRVVRLDIANDAFLSGEVKLAGGFSERIDELLPLLKQAISVLRLNYLADVETEALAEERLELIKSLIAERWQALDCCYNLIIEEEIYWRNGRPRTPGQQDPAEVQP